MSDLRFALDDLYASGWWPSDGDRCLQYEDGRWYPDESVILAFFGKSIIHPQFHQSSASASVEVVWSTATRGRQAVRGRSREEALILVFTNLYRETHAQTPSI